MDSWEIRPSEYPVLHWGNVSIQLEGFFEHSHEGWGMAPTLVIRVKLRTG
jgi:hypothetical protein